MSPQKTKRKAPISWKTLLPIPIFSMLILGFGCSMAAHRADTTSLPPQIPKTIASPRAFPPSSAPKNIQAIAAIVIDAKTGKTLYEKNADQKMPVASTQKILTALIGLKEGPLSEPIPVSLSAAMEPPSKAGLRWKQTYTRKNLLKAILIESANDAATCLAEANNYEQFIQKMNQTARRFGAKNSQFQNAHGLDAPGQYSTARDLAIIAFHAYRNPFIRQTVLTPTQYLQLDSKSETLLKNTNSLIQGISFNGMKGGFTFQSGKTLIASAKKGDREAIIVLLNSPAKTIPWEADTLWKWSLHQSH